MLCSNRYRDVLKIPLTVAVITKNEEANIAQCLESVYGWADEIVLVDDESRDRTVEIAQKYADKIFFRKMDNEGTHRNWTYSQAKNEWVLSLDADEMVSPELRDEITSAIRNPDFQAYSIPLKGISKKQQNILTSH